MGTVTMVSMIPRWWKYLQNCNVIRIPSSWKIHCYLARCLRRLKFCNHKYLPEHFKRVLFSMVCNFKCYSPNGFWALIQEWFTANSNGFLFQSVGTQIKYFPINISFDLQCFSFLTKICENVGCTKTNLFLESKH